jgi:hypothetical protein
LGALAALIASTALAQVANPGFESPIAADGPPFVGSWESFSGGAGATSATSTLMPRTGAQHLDMTISATDNTFAGVFQDIPGMLPGTPVTYSLWHKRVGVLDLDAEVRIEWRNSVSNTEISRTQLVPTAAITTDYTLFALPDVVPAGVDTARIVYALQTFSGGAANTGTVYVDDVTFIPEPASAALVGLGCAMLVGMRRRFA